MLNLESRMEVLGITVFQDSDRPNQFYYLPGSPHITYEKGQPLFDLFSFRKGGEAGKEMAGGFLNMVVDIGLGSLKDRIEDKLKEQYGDDVTLASVPFTKGTTRVIALGEDSKALIGGVENETAPSGGPLVASGPRFIQKMLGAGQPSMDGDNRSIFSFSLSEDGTAFFLSVLSGNVSARPVGVIYELSYVGLLPAYELEITIDFKSSYEYLRQRFTLGTLLFKADVDNIVEELQRRESIKIKEVSRTLELSKPEAVRERQDRIDRLVKDLATGALFQPSLIPGEPRVKGDTITAEDPSRTATTTSTSTTSTAGSALQHGPSAAVAAGTGDMLARRERVEGAATPGGATPSTPGGTTPTGEPGTGSQQPTTAADLWNRIGRPQAAFAMKELRQEERRTVTYNLSQVTAQEQTVVPQSFVQFLASPYELNQRVHVVDLNHPFFQRININVNARDVDFEREGVGQMVVQLRYGTRPDGSRPKDTAEVILRSRDDARDFTFFADSKFTQSYEYKLIVDYRSDFGIGIKDPRIESPWIPTEARSLSVHPSWLGRTLPVTLQLAPNTPADVAEARVRVRYVNPARNVDDSTVVQLLPKGEPKTVYIRLADAKEQFEVAPTLYYSDGKKEELGVIHLPDPASGAADEAVLVSVPGGNLLAGDVIMQDPLGELASVLVDMQVKQNNSMVESTTYEMTSPMQRKEWSVRLPERGKPAQLSYRQRLLYKDGGLEEEDWRDAISNNLKAGIPAEGTQQVTIKYAGPDPSGIKLSGILVELEYTDPQGDPKFDQSKSVLITDEAGSRTQDWKFRMADRDARNYRWKLTLLREDGTESSTDFRADNRKELILRLPPQ